MPDSTCAPPAASWSPTSQTSPASSARPAAPLADAEVNIEQAYIAAGSKLVIVCDDVDRAKELLGAE